MQGSPLPLYLYFKFLPLRQFHPISISSGAQQKCCMQHRSLMPLKNIHNNITSKEQKLKQKTENPPEVAPHRLANQLQDDTRWIKHTQRANGRNIGCEDIVRIDPCNIIVIIIIIILLSSPLSSSSSFAFASL